MRRWTAHVLLALAWAAPLTAQEEQGLAAPCSHPNVPSSAREVCLTVAQAAESGQPQLGILLAAGNPTLGVASTGGIRLGVLPRVSATAKLNVVFVELPDILARQAGGAVERINKTVGLPAPALSGTVSVGVFPGVSVAPTIGGIGSVDLIGTASWLPLRALGVEGFSDGTSELAYGGGVRVGVLRESFLTPGVSLSLLYRRLPELSFGDVCEGTFVPVARDSMPEYTVTGGACTEPGDRGEFSFDLGDWSARAAIGKRLLGFGLTAGLGYDSFGSDVAFGFRAPPGRTPLQEHAAVRVDRLRLRSDRWSAFGNASFTLLVATIAVEAGWMQGERPIEGFPSASDFDPRDGTLFGSAGVRLAF